MSTNNIIKLVLILTINLGLVSAMISKKISTLLALPIMGIATAVIASIGIGPDWSWFDQITKEINPLTKQPIVKLGIMNGVVSGGAVMMASAMSAAIFGSAFSKILSKVGVGEEIIKRSAELAGDKPLVIGLVFFLASCVIFAAITGLGGVILIGSVALPIMLSAGIAPTTAASIVLLGISAGGLINPANYATFAAILAPTMSSAAEAYNMVAQMSIPLFIIIFTVSIIFIIFSIGTKTKARHSSVERPKQKTKRLPIYVLITPLVPVIIIIITTIFKKTFTAEIAIPLGMLYLLIVAKVQNKMSVIVSSFVEGTKDVAGALVLLIGLGMLIKGFQFANVTLIIEPAIKYCIKFLNNPLTYVIGFTLATPLVLYRGPLNTFGIGGALPVIFASSGFSPLAIIWVLRATGNMQGFADPTNSQNIWIADFVQIDPNQITKKLFLLGIIMSLLVLTYAVFIAHINLIA